MRFFERLRKKIFPNFRFEKWYKQGLMYLSCGFYFQTERWIDMPRMSKKRKQEWALFLNDRNRITYNELCRKCRNDCKQSFHCIVTLCPKYLSLGDGKSKLILSIAVLLSKGKPLSFTQAEENDLILSSIRQRKMTQTIR